MINSAMFTSNTAEWATPYGTTVVSINYRIAGEKLK